MRFAGPPDSIVSPQALRALERWSARATLLILVGIVGEIVSMFVFRRPETGWTEIGLAVAWDAFIGIGLVVEYICILRAVVATDEAETESNEQIAAANELATQSTIRLEELRARLVPKFVGPKLTEALFGLPSETATVLYVRDVPETWRSAIWVSVALKMAGWIVEDPKPIPGSVSV